MKTAIDSKLLEENSIKGARGALINITGSKDMPLHEIEEAISLIHEEADEDANIIFGTVFEEEMGDKVKVTVIATGFDNQVYGKMAQAPPVDNRAAAAPQLIQPNQDINKKREDEEEDINIPTFIRRQAD